MAKLIELEHTHFNFHYCLPDQTHFLHLLARFFLPQPVIAYPSACLPFHIEYEIT